MERIASQVQEDIISAAEVHATRKKVNRKVFPPWWNPDLTRARKEVRVAARSNDTNEGRRSYNRKRNVYTRLLRSSKISSWRKFCTLEGKLPWGKLYRWMKGGNRSPMVIGLLRLPNG